MKKLVIAVGVTVLSCNVLLAQEVNQSENLIQFDPLFWKEKLKLDPDQCQKIKEINGEYYESLFTAYEEEKNNREVLRQLADKSLLQRNHEIWETFHPKQRKRWKRMWQASLSQRMQNES